MKTDKPHFITPDQLRVGLYVHIDLGWMDHPFTFNNFKIKNEDQIAEIRKLGLARLRFDPLRSDCEPLPVAPEPVVAEAPATIAQPEPEPEVDAEQQEEAFQKRRLAQLQEAIQECERKYTQTTSTVRLIEREILVTPPKTLQQADELVGSMLETLLTEGEIVLHAMQPKIGNVEQVMHSLNVTVLSLILAKSLDMTESDARQLGIGALFHDLGKSQIPDRISKKVDPLTKAEISLMQQHSAMGAKIAKDIGMAPEAIRIIEQHHESVDGSGYPAKLKNGDISRLARIVAITNLYDNLCNPLNIGQAMTPYEALSHMFAHQRSKCDPDILKLLIKSLGVYPPGSLVKLSNEVHAIVVSVNPSKPLRPYVLLHAPDAPRTSPVLVNLGEEAGLSITHCLRPSQLPKDALEYLNPALRINYYFDKEVAPD